MYIYICIYTRDYILFHDHLDERPFEYIVLQFSRTNIPFAVQIIIVTGHNRFDIGIDVLVSGKVARSGLETAAG